MSFQLHTFTDFLLSATLVKAAGTTVLVATLSVAIAALAGLGLALARVSNIRPLQYASIAYIYVGRGVPTLLWLLLVWNALPQLVPQTRESWFSPLVAAVIALSLSEAAYMAEIARSGLLAVDPGQRLAGKSLGMTSTRILRRIVLPQAVRVAIPAAGNEYISIVKLTSLASVISLQEIIQVTEQQISTTFRFAELYAAAAVWYLLVVSVFMVLQYIIERRMNWDRTAASVRQARRFARPGRSRAPEGADLA
jgi:His/Glu/Gln/Arg/opine family amino acid ABC transporter permease subunit